MTPDQKPDHRPRLSIVTPCLNARSTIMKAIDSVKEQGHDDVEHIVVDGGSTDGTLELLDGVDGVTVVSEPDEGLSDALNKGIALARGDLIGWLNADDWYLPGAFDTVLAAAENSPGAPWITGRCVIVDQDGREIRRRVSQYKNLWLRHYTFGRYLTHNFISCPATFIRSDVYRRVGPYQLHHHYSMDYDMFLRVAHVGDPVVVDEDLATFAMVDGTKSMTGFETQFREHFQIAKERGAGHPIAVAINWSISQSIIALYRAMRWTRRLRRS